MRASCNKCIEDTCCCARGLVGACERVTSVVPSAFLFDQRARTKGSTTMSPSQHCQLSELYLADV